MSTPWLELSPSEETEIWAAFQQRFGFETTAAEGNGITEPTPSVTYSVSSLLSLRDEPFLEKALDVNSKALISFRNCTKTGESLYALDWQHQCYRFFPHAENLDPWCIDVFPYGDYTIFLSENLGFGTFGHPWNETVCVFGERLLREFEKNLPDTFKEMRRN